MIPPEIAGSRLGIACLLGMGLGLIYGFLRPVRRKGSIAADTAFIVTLFAVWLYLSFGICDGDLRPGYLLGLTAGCILWDITAGRWLRPVFSGIWNFVFCIFKPFRNGFHKFFQKLQLFCKKLFASGKKSGTIEWNMYPHIKQNKGGCRHGKPKQSIQPDSSGLQTQQHPYQSGRTVRYRIVYGSTSDHPPAAGGRSGNERLLEGSGRPAGAGQWSAER
jgi:hypothetical protein